MAIEIMTTSEIAQKAEQIYAENYQAEYETEYKGHYAVIDITDETIYVAEFPEIAMKKAIDESPDGIFHLIRTGSAASVYHLGHLGRHHVSSHTGSIR